MITLFDTSIASKNIGDFIIMDAVREQLSCIIPFEHMVTLPTHDYIGKEGRRILNQSDYALVGGTNLLSSHLLNYMQWKLHFKDLFYLNKAVLMGVGWWQYQSSPDKYSKVIWNQILNNEMLHSVRDSFTEKMLLKMGVTNVINTSCSTMWNLTPEHCRGIKHSKADSVIATLTDYNQDRDADLSFMNCLLDNYSDVYFWPQGTGDIHYFQSLLTSLNREVKLLNPNLESLNKALLAGNVDYIGTRLHAGIRALQYKVRTVIIGIDNRAIEKSHDFNLTVLDRKEIDGLNSLININIKTEINLPIENINAWKSQFTSKTANLK